MAVITGGDGGIGRAAADAREGDDVLVANLNEDDDAAETSQRVSAAGRKCVLVRGDLADRAHRKSVIEKAVEAFGRVDILVNSAAFR